MAKNNNQIKRQFKLGVCSLALCTTLSYVSAANIMSNKTPETQTVSENIEWDNTSTHETIPQEANYTTLNEVYSNKGNVWGSRSQDMEATVLTQAHKNYFKEALSMKDALMMFLQHNPTIKSASYNRDAVEQEKDQARSEFFPTLDGEASVGREYRNVDYRAKSTDKYVNNFQLNARQNLFNGFGSVSQWKRQQARQYSATERLNSQVEFNGLDALQAYVETSQQRQLLKISEANIKKHLDTYNKIKERVNAGTSDYAELSRSESRLELAKSTYYSTLNAQQEAEARFESIIGVPPQALEEPYLIKEFMPATIEDAIALAQLHNPTLLALKADIEAAKENIGIQSAGFYPRLDLEGDAIRSHNQGGVSGADRELNGRVVARQNIFNGGRDFAKRKEAIARYEEAKFLYNEKLKTAEQEIRTAWAVHQSTNANILILEKYVNANERSRDLYLEQFNLGQRSLLNVLDADNELFQSRRELITTKNSSIFSGYRMIATMGHLMRTFGIEVGSN